ncbi:NRDE family protein [Halorientalis salina]|uniref:NRDE family protein n=1 Tax=Halorientalis salina TaxID=2932266 RepID=UPI0010ACF580|nr:NRDE family protein [Halorientalis salina]
MCTLVIAWQVFADTPVAVAANRDELLDRPSEPPATIANDPRIVAPQDGDAGGTWIGYNEHGVFAAITNRWVDADLAGDRSRGLLVRDVLEHESAEDAARFVEREVDAHEFEGFNLVVADSSAAVLLEWGGRLAVRNLDPGVHVVVNVGADGDFFVPSHRPDAGQQQAENATAVRTALQPEPGERAGTWLERAADVISDHEYGVCVHHDRFGTRSSSLLTIGPGGANYRFAPGPPCETEYHSVDADL